MTNSFNKPTFIFYSSNNNMICNNINNPNLKYLFFNDIIDIDQNSSNIVYSSFCNNPTIESNTYSCINIIKNQPYTSFQFISVYGIDKTSSGGQDARDIILYYYILIKILKGGTVFNYLLYHCNESGKVKGNKIGPQINHHGDYIDNWSRAWAFKKKFTQGCSILPLSECSDINGGSNFPQQEIYLTIQQNQGKYSRYLPIYNCGINDNPTLTLTNPLRTCLNFCIQTYNDPNNSNLNYYYMAASTLDYGSIPLDGIYSDDEQEFNNSILRYCYYKPFIT